MDKDVLFYVITSKAGGVKTVTETIFKKDKVSKMLEISERENFLEFINDNGDYKRLCKAKK